MSPLLLGTIAVSLDEPCLLLKEEHLQAPDSKGWRRYQTVVVMRFDRPAEFKTDMGPASDFEGIQQFRIPGGCMDRGRYYVVHTVGELLDIAILLRTGVVKPPEFAPLDLIGGYHDHIEQKHLAARRRSVVGRYHHVERN